MSSLEATIEELPGDILGVLFGCLGFHSSLAASHASKTLHKAPDAAAGAAPPPPLGRDASLKTSGDRNLRDRDSRPST